MGFGDSITKKSPGICFMCKQTMQGSKMVKGSPTGWAACGSRSEEIAICINPYCSQGKENLSKKS